MKTKLRILSSLLLILFVLSTGLQAHETSEPAFHFVITGGLKGVSDGSRPFYGSPLFRLHSNAQTGEQFSIKNASAKALRYRNTYFVSRAPISKDDLQNAIPLNQSGEIGGLMGAQLISVALQSESVRPQNFEAANLKRELGAISVVLKWEMRRFGNIEILALASAHDGSMIEWPKSSDGVDDILSVYGQFGVEAKQEYVFLPREIASTQRVFGIVDEILEKNPNAQYLDLGNALLSPNTEDLQMAKNLQGLLLKRKPVVLGAGWNDFRAFGIDQTLMLDNLYVSALSGNEILPSTREVKNEKGHAITFAALPNDAPVGLVLPEGTKQEDLEVALKKIGLMTRKNASGLVIGLAQDAKAAARAIESPLFDAVISLGSAKAGALPSFDEIDLSKNQQEGLKSVAPLVRVSSADVTEVRGYLNSTGSLVRLTIERNAVVDGGRVAKDAAQIQEAYENKVKVIAPGLPSRANVALKGVAYTESELNRILGGILKEVKPGTELAILETKEDLTPIESEIPLSLAEALLNDRGRAVWISIRGKYVKRIFKAIKENQFDLAVSVVGGTIKGPTIGERQVSDNETYLVVVSERVFFAIDRFMARESLFALRNLPSNTVQSAMLEGGRETLKILSEVRKRDSLDDPDIGEARALFASSLPISELTDSRLSAGLSAEKVTSLLSKADGEISRAFILDISDLDFGLKLNTINENLELWQKQAREENANPGFPESRFTDPVFSQKLIYAKMSLKYVGKLIDAEIGTNIKFFQPNTEGSDPLGRSDISRIRPAKDSVRFEAEMRIPFRRLFDEPPLGFWDLGAVTRFSYDTQIWPNAWLTNLPPELYPFRVNNLRLLLGLSLKPLAAGETMHVGGVVDYDLSRNSSLQALGLGYEVGAQGSWNIGFINLKVDSTVRQLFPIATPETSRMGLVWTVDGKASVPVYGGFSVSLVTNTILGTRMEQLLTPGYSVLFGFALSYSDRIKWSL